MLTLDRIVSHKLPHSVLDLHPDKPGPRKFLLTGPPGIGKTAIARAISSRLMGLDAAVADRDLAEVAPFDFRHVNAGDEGIDRIREIAAESRLAPLSGVRCRAYNLDEIHALPEKAIQALLIPLDDDPRNVWVCCTSKPAGSLDPALRSRLGFKLALEGADVAAVLVQEGAAPDAAARAAKKAEGDVRVGRAVLRGGDVGGDDEAGELGLGVDGRLNTSARGLYFLAVKSPTAAQAKILDLLFARGDAHAAMAINLSHRNDVAAHQLVAAARKLGLVRD